MPSEQQLTIAQVLALADEVSMCAAQYILARRFAIFMGKEVHNRPRLAYIRKDAIEEALAARRLYYTAKAKWQALRADLIVE